MRRRTLEQRLALAGCAVEFLTAEPDALGRRRFILDWPGPSGPRAQCFFAPFEATAERLLANLAERRGG